MLKYFYPSLAVLVLLLQFACSPVAQSPTDDQSPKVALATEQNLNADWLFFKSQSADLTATPEDWQLVSLPHTPQIEPLLVNNQWQGFAWYQKSLTIAPEWQDKQLLIRFEAAMNYAEVWLDDKQIGEHLGGYLPFTIDLTPYVTVGETYQLKVKLDNRDNEVTGPKPLAQLDFNTYGGLYRDVRLLIKNPVHITDEMLAYEVAGGGIFVTYPKVDKAGSVVAVKTQLANQSAVSAELELVQQLFVSEQLVTEVSSGPIQLAAGAKLDQQQQLTVTKPNLWSPASPFLYSLHTVLKQNGEVIERQQQQIGIRSFAFNDKHQLLINGDLTFLRGVNRHQEYPHVGYAISPQADYRDAVKIKSAGFDYVRLSHYPHSKAFMQAADELGLVLINAILGWQYYQPTEAFRAQNIQSCRDLIRRDRNHASVLAWECSLNESDMPDEFVATLHNTVKQEFPGAYSAGWQHGYDMYLQARQHRQMHYETPTVPYNVSEYGDWEYYAQNAGLNQDSWADLKEEARTSRQLLSHGEARLLQQARNVQEAHNDNLTTPAYADGYWVMFDYNRGYANDLEASGVMSIYRLPKYSYYFFQSQRPASEQSDKYQSGPMVFIASEWQSGSSAQVRVFSNAEEVELYLNGFLVSRNKPSVDKFSTHLPHPPFEFDLKEFKAGQLLAKAYIAGKEVATHQVSTADIAASLKLTLETSGVAPVPGDLVFVYAEVLDKNGQTVPLNNQIIEFNSSGDIEIINPEPAFTEQGKAAVLVKLGAEFSKAQMEASSKVLAIQSDTLVFAVKE
ncbi:sugar-binding domain-containing protein [Rheinheimera soli]|uniref:Beta-galactosidase n=1 Tax=Rheinheimera soli TaxID=443616 RepID=A0ABU1VX73_9GAMM|nr:sugar-binding domain-containing protein [Rheinheimera soli]MDR7120190.1 beta-galactosidase [Rheinheimera soli]